MRVEKLLTSATMLDELRKLLMTSLNKAHHDYRHKCNELIMKEPINIAGSDLTDVVFLLVKVKVLEDILEKELDFS